MARRQALLGLVAFDPHTGYRNVAGFHNYLPGFAVMTKEEFNTSGYAEFMTVLTEGAGVRGGQGRDYLLAAGDVRAGHQAGEPR